MNSPQKDIALIRKYYNGELSPAEKNQLEARALDDPFLQDALDGFEDNGVGNDEILALEHKLNQRLNKETKVIAPVWGVKQWGIAASILVGIAVASIYFNQTPKNKTIALNEIQQKEDIPQAEKLKIRPVEDSDLNAPAELAVKENQSISPNGPAEVKAKTYHPEPDIQVEPVAESSSAEDSIPDLPEVAVIGNQPQYKNDMNGAMASARAEGLMKSKIMRVADAPSFKLTGKIVDNKDGNVLPGVSIKNLETGTVKQTDANGLFSIEANNQDDLVVSYLGYETKQLSVKQQDSILVKLKPDEAALSEVVVVGYGRSNATSESIAAPKVGWKRFKSYLDNQASNFDIGRGKVQVEFIIKPNGEVSDFKIKEAFSAKAGVAAINIIKNYNGGWSGSSNQVPHKASIIIKFQ